MIDNLHEWDLHKELMKLILKSAINDYLGYEPKRELHQMASQWLFNDIEENNEIQLRNIDNGFISFQMICDELEFDIERLRLLIKCREDQRKKRLVDSQFEELFSLC